MSRTPATQTPAEDDASPRTGTPQEPAPDTGSGTSAQTTSATATARADGGSGQVAGVSPRAMLRSLIPDIGIPVAGYYVLHVLGAGDRTALLTATALAGLRVLWGVLRERTVNLFASVILVAFAVGAVLSLVSGDARFLLLKNSFTTGAIGLVFLATVLWGRPLTLAAAESFHPARAAAFREQYRSEPRIRRGHRLCSAVWGLGLLLESLLRIPLVYLLPVSVMVGLSELIMIATMVALATWNVVYIRRARRRMSAGAAPQDAPAPAS
ncbi:uncharacterized protein DUF3159 [Streptomyces sp. Amel2xB2]|uniref:VC0807 family protein n=1 Tax=Streptomyces sp. Amel2xB2 TaxID=1305829 RepID=UPI000DC02B14|nr:VC0807 family protein [Streptomyces sp. Amel2xB2]RAJ70145.1 uncharacterized protein DUF3159 [Streptomyces sp. Amel2xB2]